MTEQDLCGMLGLLSPTVCLLWVCNLLMWGEEEGGNKKRSITFFFKIPVGKCQIKWKIKKKPGLQNLLYGLCYAISVSMSDA